MKNKLPTNQFDLIQKGYKILQAKMGPTDTLRFIMSFNSGAGDSVKEFQEFWGDKSISQIAKKIRSN